MDTKSAPVNLKAFDDVTGDFTAIVAVFGNVDREGDRIVPGAFADTLAEWRASGDPIPVIYSHQWDNLDAHIGWIDPADARELLPGDPDLPPELADLGGLFVSGHLDVADNPTAARAAALMRGRRLKEFSFGFAVRPGGAAMSGRVQELRSLDLFEVGPTLVGMNPSTVLVGAKAEPVAGKASALAAGSMEATRDAVASALRTMLRAGGVDLYALWLEATFPDRVVYYMETWDEPADGGSYYEVAYTLDSAGVATITGDPVAVTFDLAINPKANRPEVKSGRRNSAADADRIQAILALAVELGADPTILDSPDPANSDEDPAAPQAASAAPAPKNIPPTRELLDTVRTALTDL